MNLLPYFSCEIRFCECMPIKKLIQALATIESDDEGDANLVERRSPALYTTKATRSVCMARHSSPPSFGFLVQHHVPDTADIEVIFLFLGPSDRRGVQFPPGHTVGDSHRQ